MKKKINISSLLFLVMLLSLFLLNLFQQDKPNYSEIENRALNGRPEFTWESFWDGSYFIKVENYFADTFVFREPLAKMSRLIHDLGGFRGEDDVQLVMHYGGNYGEPILQPDEPVFHSTYEEIDVQLNADAEQEEGEAKQPEEDSELQEIAERAGGNSEPQTDIEQPNEGPDISEQLEQETELADKPTEEEQVSQDDSSVDQTELEPAQQEETQQMIGRILLMRDKAMNLYSFSEAAGEAYANVINEFSEKTSEISERDLTIYSLLAPTQIEFIADSRYKELSAPQDETIAFINQRLEDTVIPVDVYTALEDHAKEYLYFRTDHHWTARGAYYAYTAFMEASGQTAVPLEDYEMKKVEGFLGSTYSATLSKNLEKNPDTIELFQPFIEHEYHIYYAGPLKMDVLDMSHADKKNKYRIFLSGDRPWGHIASETESVRSIAVIKDSYANAFVPFLIPHYKDIYIIDPRQFEKDIFEFIDERQIDDILFMTNMGVTSHQGFTNLLKEMIER